MDNTLRASSSCVKLIPRTTCQMFCAKYRPSSTPSFKLVFLAEPIFGDLQILHNSDLNWQTSVKVLFATENVKCKSYLAQNINRIFSSKYFIQTSSMIFLKTDLPALINIYSVLLQELQKPISVSIHKHLKQVAVVYREIQRSHIK